MKKSKNTDKFYELIFQLACVLCFLIIWEVAVYFFRVPKYILPAPSIILKSLWNSRQLIWFHSGRTLIEAVLGLFTGAIAGIIAAVIMDSFSWGRKIILPIALISQSVPFIALTPLLVIWFGYGISSKIIIVALVCFFPVCINLYQSLSFIEGKYMRLLNSLNAGSWQSIKMVKIPGSMPGLYSGLRIAGAYAFLTAVISEWIGSDRGLGIVLIRSSKSYLTERVFAVIIVISVLTILLIKLIDSGAARTIPWYFRKNLNKGENL